MHIHPMSCGNSEHCSLRSLQPVFQLLQQFNRVTYYMEFIGLIKNRLRQIVFIQHIEMHA